jgi:hypothetical protein
MDMTKASVKAALGFKSDAELARFFDVHRQAVGQWEENKPIPGARQWELRVRRPELFVLVNKKTA